MTQRVFIIMTLVFVLFACSTSQKVAKNNATVISNEAVEREYGVEMFDAKFEAWYKKYKEDVSVREQSYYEFWNQEYVPVWNIKAQRSAADFPFEPVVGYNENKDYGFDLNHKLFHYFMYVEKVLDIRILSVGPDFELL